MTFAAALLHLPIGWLLAQLVLRRWPVVRLNFRKQEIPVGTGLAQWLGLAGAVCWLTAGSDIAWWSPFLLVNAMGLAGWLDDRYGDRNAGGFRGHVLAALRGNFTTGFAKLCIGGCASLLAVWGVHRSLSIWLLADALAIALSANLVNLFDLRPGRARAIYLVQIGVVAVSLVYRWTNWQWIVTAIGAVLPDARRDSRGEAMLGDTGANVLGAFAGFAIIVGLPESARIVWLTTLIALNILSERVSFSRIIDNVGWLRRLDRRLGVRDPL